MIISATSLLTTTDARSQNCARDESCGMLT